jgi:hypothetical protein
MADTGSTNEGHEGAGDSASDSPKQENTGNPGKSEPTGEAWLQKLDQIEQEIAADKAEHRAIMQYEATQQRQLPRSWLEAIATDERAHNTAPRTPAPMSRSSGRYRGRQSPKPWTESQRTRWDIQNNKTSPSDPKAQYAKGNQERFWGKMAMAFFRFLGVE